MKRELLSIAFGLGLCVYACSSDDDTGSDQGGKGGSDEYGGNSNPSGGSSIGSGGTTPSATAGTTAIPSQGGTAGAAANNAGAGSTLDCGLLCPGGVCSAQPTCLAQAMGLAAGEAIPVCIPPTVAATLSICASTQCSNGQPGCQLMAQLGTASWNLAATADPSVTNVTLSALVTGMPGAIDIVMQQTPLCTLSINVPSAGVALTASGKVSAKATNPSLRGLVFEQVQADYAGLTVDSTVDLCRTQGNLLLGTASSSISAALLENLNSRAQSLSCLACRADCPEQLACSAQ